MNKALTSIFLKELLNLLLTKLFFKINLYANTYNVLFYLSKSLTVYKYTVGYTQSMV